MPVEVGLRRQRQRRLVNLGHQGLDGDLCIETSCGSANAKGWRTAADTRHKERRSRIHWRDRGRLWTGFDLTAYRNPFNCALKLRLAGRCQHNDAWLLLLGGRIGHTQGEGNCRKHRGDQSDLQNPSDSRHLLGTPVANSRVEFLPVRIPISEPRAPPAVNYFTAGTSVSPEPPLIPEHFTLLTGAIGVLYLCRARNPMRQRLLIYMCSNFTVLGSHLHSRGSSAGALAALAAAASTCAAW